MASFIVLLHFSRNLTRGILTSFRFGGFDPPVDFLFVDGFWFFFSTTTKTSDMDIFRSSFNHVFSSFWLTAFLLDFCPTFFWSKVDAWDNSYWNYISTCLGKIYFFFFFISQDSYKKFGLGHVGLVETKIVKHSEHLHVLLIKKQNI